MAKRKKRKLWRPIWTGPNQDVLDFMAVDEKRTMQEQIDAIKWNVMLHLEPNMSRRAELLKWAQRVKTGIDVYVAAWTYAAEHPESKWRGRNRG